MDIVGNEKLSELDGYKDPELIGAINECNLYVQSEAFINLIDTETLQPTFLQRDCSALETVMDYVNKESIPRDALYDQIYKLSNFMNEERPKKGSKLWESLNLAVSILEKILIENSFCKICVCKKDFTLYNYTKLGQLAKLDICKNTKWYLTDEYMLGTKPICIIFHPLNCNWVHLSKNELDEHFIVGIPEELKKCNIFV